MPALNFNNSLGFLQLLSHCGCVFDCFSIFCIVKLFVSFSSWDCGACLICRDVTCRRTTASAGMARVCSALFCSVQFCAHPMHQLFNVGNGNGKYLSKSILYARPLPGRRMGNVSDIAHAPLCLAAASVRTSQRPATCRRRRASFVLAANLSNARWQPTKLSLFGYHFPGCVSCFLLCRQHCPPFGYLPAKPLPKATFTCPLPAQLPLTLRANNFCAPFPHCAGALTSTSIKLGCPWRALRRLPTHAKVHTSNVFQGWLLFPYPGICWC